MGGPRKVDQHWWLVEGPYHLDLGRLECLLLGLESGGDLLELFSFLQMRCGKMIRRRGCCSEEMIGQRRLQGKYQVVGEVNSLYGG